MSNAELVWSLCKQRIIIAIMESYLRDDAILQAKTRALSPAVLEELFATVFLQDEWIPTPPLPKPKPRIMPDATITRKLSLAAARKLKLIIAIEWEDEEPIRKKPIPAWQVVFCLTNHDFSACRWVNGIPIRKQSLRPNEKTIKLIDVLAWQPEDDEDPTGKKHFALASKP